MVCCGGETAETTEMEVTESSAPAAAPTTNTEKLARIAPPPPVCTFLTEAEVLSLFPAEVKIPLPGQRSPLAFHSCQYTLEAPEWSGALVVERPEDPREQQGIRNQVAGREGVGLKFMDHPARSFNGGRVLCVASEPPFRVKFSPLAKRGFETAYSEEELRELLEKMAGLVLQ